MTVFALVHGAWGVPEEWTGVCRALADSGHLGVGVDLPIADPRAGLREYADAIVRAVAHVAEPVVVVGHSASGAAAALVPSLRPVRRLVYLSAFVPEPGRPLRDDLTRVSAEFRALVVDGADGTTVLDIPRLARFLGGDAASDGLSAMLAGMIRPTGRRAFDEPWPLAALPDVPATYLLAGADRVLAPSEQRLMAARARAAPEEIAGADHGCHLRRPRDVARRLVSDI